METKDKDEIMNQKFIRGEKVLFIFSDGREVEGIIGQPNYVKSGNEFEYLVYYDNKSFSLNEKDLKKKEE